MRTPLNVVDNVVSAPSYEGNAQTKKRKAHAPRSGYHALFYT
jgi:hypothetical protein